MIVGKDDKGEGYDYGSWFFGLVEFSIVFSWIFMVFDMYNIDLGKVLLIDDSGEKVVLYYFCFDVFYMYGVNCFFLSYIKQVEGVVCIGGICCFELVFSGVCFMVNFSF